MIPSPIPKEIGDNSVRPKFFDQGGNLLVEQGRDECAQFSLPLCNHGLADAEQGAFLRQLRNVVVKVGCDGTGVRPRR
jgi:hypothetical protein